MKIAEFLDSFLLDQVAYAFDPHSNALAHGQCATAREHTKDSSRRADHADAANIAPFRRSEFKR